MKKASELQFIELMNHFDKKISITSEIGKNRGLLWNLIAWSTYFHRPTSLSSEINGVATFSLLGNIQTIMDKGMIIYFFFFSLSLFFSSSFLILR